MGLRVVGYYGMNANFQTPLKENPYKEKKKHPRHKASEHLPLSNCEVASGTNCFCFVFQKEFRPIFFPRSDIHRNGHKNQPGPHDIKNLF